MRWLKHLSDAHRNINLSRLIDEWGLKGYGRWWILVELVADRVRPKDLSFSLQDNNNSPMTVRELCGALRGRSHELERFLGYLATNNLIDRAAWEEKKLIFIPKLRELTDRYTAKVSRLCTQDVSLEEEVDEDVEEEVQKETHDSIAVEIPQALLSKPGFTDAWAAWQQHRKELRKPLTPLAIKKQLKFLEAQADPVAVINQSIQNSWQGLFPFRGGQPLKPARPRRDAIAVNLEQMRINEMVAELEKPKSQNQPSTSDP
jgi:hypothetical protein